MGASTSTWSRSLLRSAFLEESPLDIHWQLSSVWNLLHRISRQQARAERAMLAESPVLGRSVAVLRNMATWQTVGQVTSAPRPLRRPSRLAASAEFIYRTACGQDKACLARLLSIEKSSIIASTDL